MAAAGEVQVWVSLWHQQQPPTGTQEWGRGEETLYVTWKGEQFGFTDLSSPQYWQGWEIQVLLLNMKVEEWWVDITLWISGVNFCKFSISVPSVAEHWSKLNCAHSDYSEFAHAHLSSSLAAADAFAAVGRSFDTLLLFCCLFLYMCTWSPVVIWKDSWLNG